MTRPRQLERARGAALVETAFTLIFLLGFLFAGVQLGLVGYYTLLADYSAQTQARFASFDVNRDQAIALMRSSMGNLTDKRIAFDNSLYVNSVPIDKQNMDFNFQDPSKRTGGFQFTAPVQTIGGASTTQDLLHIGNIPIQITARAVEPVWVVVCFNFCADPNSSTDQVKNGGDWNDSTWYYFGANNYTPYYDFFAGINTCGADAKADLSQAVWQEWDSCPDHHVVLRGLGLAGHLDMSNNFYEAPGERLDSSYNGMQNLAPRPDQAGPFFASWCHRRIFARIDTDALEDQPDVPGDAASSKAFLSKIFGADSGGSPKAGSIIYNDARMFKAQPDTVELGDWSGSLPDPFYNVINGYPTRLLQTGDSGWDSTIVLENNDPNNIVYGRLSPWWGCGVHS